MQKGKGKKEGIIVFFLFLVFGNEAKRKSRSKRMAVNRKRKGRRIGKNAQGGKDKERKI